MEPLTKTIKGIEVVFTMKRYDKERNKLWVEFAVKGTKYRNAQVLSNVATQQEIDASLASLQEWAQTVIKENMK